jgi:orotidine-5'-phosphate decarboxylase
MTPIPFTRSDTLIPNCDTNPAGRLFVALDLPGAAEARRMAAALAPAGVGLKVGLELFNAAGPDLVRDLAAKASVFLDLKFHDIPNTVAGAVRAAGGLGVAMLNLHVSGGEAMARAALAARDEAGRGPAIIGVTVLTSLDGEDLGRVWGRGSGRDAAAEALRLAELARDWGLDGVVASAQEAAAIRAACGEDFLIVTPGIRPAGEALGDQKRVSTPDAAIAAGASHLVVGRPVTRAEDPAAACAAILAAMGGASV